MKARRGYAFVTYRGDSMKASGSLTMFMSIPSMFKHV